MKENTEMNMTETPAFPAATARTSVRSGRTKLTPAACSIGATVGIFGGISSLIAGLICIAVHCVVPSDVVFASVGTKLLILGIPMLLVGSGFLDAIDKTRS